MAVARAPRASWRPVAVTLAVLLVAALTVLALARQPDEDRPPLDSRSAAADGALGLHDAARRLGWTVARAHAPAARFGPDATYLAIHATHGLDAHDVGRLLAAVRAGAGLVVDVRDDPLTDSLRLLLGEDGPWVLDNPAAARAVGATAAVTRPGCAADFDDQRAGTWRVSWAIADTLAGDARRRDRRVFLDARRDTLVRPVVLGLPLGRGRVVAVSDGAVVTNDALRVCWAAAGPAVLRALEWASPRPGRAGAPRGALVFLDERRTSAGAAERADVVGATRDALVEVPLGRAALQAIAAALVLLVAAMGRALPPVPAAAPQRRSPLEHAGALARAYREARATRLAARRLARGLRRRWGASTAGPAPRPAARADAASPDVRFLAEVARRHPTVAADAARLTAALDAPVAPEALVAVGESAARLDGVLAAARHGGSAAPPAADATTSSARRPTA